MSMNQSPAGPKCSSPSTPPCPEATVADQISVPLASADYGPEAATSSDLLPWEMLELDEPAVDSATEIMEVGLPHFPQDDDDGLPQDFVQTLNLFTTAVGALPTVSDALQEGLRLNAECAKLKAARQAGVTHGDSEVTATRNLEARMAQLSELASNIGAAGSEIAGNGQEERKDADEQGAGTCQLDGISKHNATGKGVQSSNGKGKGKANLPAAGRGTNEEKKILGGVDVERVAALAIALIEGAEPIDIAGQLLDAAERAGSGIIAGGSSGSSGGPNNASDGPEGKEAGSSGGLASLPQRVHELEGVLDVTLARVGRLEYVCNLLHDGGFERESGGSGSRL